MTDQRPGNIPEATLREYGSGQRLFGRYTLIKILGRGGMGIVWLARDEELEREVALKFLPELMVADPGALDDLKRETRRSLELTHPHIIRIHDFVHDERSACISMEYVDGETLASLRCRKEQKVFRPEELTIWMAQLCDALDYAHNRARVIHRDLKPANLMVNERGDLKVADFGIARTLAESLKSVTREQQGRSGTLSYMSPQQLDGERGTHLDDIYSLGATIYDLLTSKPPFYSGNVDRQIHERSPPSMTERRKDLNIEPAVIPPVWEETVAACLAKDPARRPQSAAEVAQRLQLAGPPIASTVSVQRPNPKMLLVGGLAAISIIALAGLYFGVLKRPAKPVSQTAAVPEKSIAVLPFENLSSEKENSYFAAGVQDEVLANLARIADLKVINRTSVIQYKSDAARNLHEIGQALGVAHVVEGSVQRVANRVRVSAQLIDARTDAHLWAETYDRDIADVFAIQSEIAQAIANQLQAKLSPTEKSAIEEQPTKDLAAYDLYLRATVLYWVGFSGGAYSEASFFEAASLLDQAIARDPEFFLAYCQLARTHGGLYFNGKDHTPTRLALADAAIAAAARLRPNSGEVHLLLAEHIYHAYLDYDHARAELALAQRTLPNNCQIFNLMALIDRRQGRWNESARNFEKALELDPGQTSYLRNTADIYELQRRFAEAAAILDRVLKLLPQDDVSDKREVRVERASIDLAWRADPRPLRVAIEAIVTEDPAAATEFPYEWFNLALCEHDPVTANRALAAMKAGGLGSGLGESFPRAWFEGLAARARGDAAAARAAFASARVEAEATVREQPDYGPSLCVLGMIDAALGRKEDAIREGRRAAELLPVAKDSIVGAGMMGYLSIIYAWTGEKTRAIDQVAATLQIPSDLNYGKLRLHPFWDPLRGDPRFEKIVASLAPKAAP